MTSHRCHAVGCRLPVPPEMLMCRVHWYMVPKPLRSRVWATYRRGQEVDKQPSDAWMEAATDAIRAVALEEGRPVPPAHRTKVAGKDKDGNPVEVIL